jgi:hypothetical protein
MCNQNFKKRPESKEGLFGGRGTRRVMGERIHQGILYRHMKMSS